MAIVALGRNETDITPAEASDAVMPAKAGIQGRFRDWTPVFTGVTA